MSALNNTFENNLRWGEMLYLASDYMHGDGKKVPVDNQKAVEIFRQVAKEGSPTGQYFYARSFHQGWNGAPSLSKAVKWYRKSAENGQARAQLALAIFYREGIEGIQQDFDQAQEWYQKAVKKNPGLHFEWVKKPAEEGDASAQYALGQCYLSGNGCEINETKALEWFLKAFEHGYVKAGLAAGYLMRKTDPFAALDYFESVGDLDLGVESAQGYFEAYLMFAKWGHFSDYDPDYFFDFLLKAASQGHPDSLYAIGCFSISGDYIEQDEEKGIALIQVLAEKEYQPALVYLATHYIKKGDFDGKKLLYERLVHSLSEKENGLANYGLGLCHFYGLGVEVNKALAKDYFENAAEKGVEQAVVMLLHYTAVPQDEPQGLQKSLAEFSYPEFEVKPEELSLVQKVLGGALSEVLNKMMNCHDVMKTVTRLLVKCKEKTGEEGIALQQRVANNWINKKYHKKKMIKQLKTNFLRQCRDEGIGFAGYAVHEKLQTILRDFSNCYFDEIFDIVILATIFGHDVRRRENLSKVMNCLLGPRLVVIFLRELLNQGVLHVMPVNIFKPRKITGIAKIDWILNIGLQYVAQEAIRVVANSILKVITTKSDKAYPYAVRTFGGQNTRLLKL